MRNGIAHGNIIFYPDINKEIQYVSIWNNKYKTTIREWGTTLSIDTMRSFLFNFVDLAEQLHGKQK